MHRHARCPGCNKDYDHELGTAVKDPKLKKFKALALAMAFCHSITGMCADCLDKAARDERADDLKALKVA